MENAGEWEKSLVINELVQGQEFVKQLQMHLDPSSPAELRELLLGRILSSITKALSMLKSNDSEGDPQLTGPTTNTDSPHSISGSPRSENSDRDCKDQERRDISKKRKMLPKWTEQVRICSGAGLEGPLDDGYSWRKYGQKDILGANFPRSYYRCTHRNVQGCLATKQVQRSDEDPAIFEVTYRGTHTCIQAAHLMHASSRKQEQQEHRQHQQQPQQVLLNFRSGLKVKTEDMESQKLNPSSFSFPSTTSITNNNYSDNTVKPENNIFSPAALESHFMGSFSPTFISPATSESNFFSVSPCRMSSYGGGPNLQTSESDLTEIISAATSASNSSLVDLDFRTLDDPDFPFDASNFFS
ncbi:probable WRKY transcription factor 41 [Magnolia sinica]|uniref:probable WRKY transcription factor 41 n=1 Tax=Magnolia sinica TaxID=86752 RepID=UPI0026597EE7|nr:probable WRKY transcription factor 41 [Magnolia sinica]